LLKIVTKLKIIEQGKSARKCIQYHYIKANWPVNQWFLKALRALRNAELPDTRPTVWFFGASALRTNRSTGKFSCITGRSASIMPLKFARQLGIMALF